MLRVRVLLSLFAIIGLVAPTNANLSSTRKGSLELSPATLGEFPYHVSIQLYDYQLETFIHEGSGVIVDEYHIVTSTTFMAPARIYSYQIVAGTLDAYNPTETGQIRNLTKIFWNPTYCYVQDDMKLNDNAVLRVDKPFEFNSFVRPILLPPEGHVSTGLGIISGWTTNNTSALMKLTIPLISKSDCNEYFGKYKGRTGRMCAANLSDEEEGLVLDGDFGFDEGHPIICKDLVIGQDYICGTFSFVSPKVEIKVGSEMVFVGGYPLVYSDVAMYIPWIKEMMTISNSTLV